MPGGSDVYEGAAALGQRTLNADNARLAARTQAAAAGISLNGGDVMFDGLASNLYGLDLQGIGALAPSISPAAHQLSQLQAFVEKTTSFDSQNVNKYDQQIFETYENISSAQKQLDALRSEHGVIDVRAESGLRRELDRARGVLDGWVEHKAKYADGASLSVSRPGMSPGERFERDFGRAVVLSNVALVGGVASLGMPYWVAGGLSASADATNQWISTPSWQKFEWKPVQTLVAGMSGGAFARLGKTQFFDNFLGDLVVAAGDSMVNTAYKNNFEGSNISYTNALLYNSGFAALGRAGGFSHGYSYRRDLGVWRGQANEIGALLVKNPPTMRIFEDQINKAIQLSGAVFETTGLNNR